MNRFFYRCSSCFLKFAADAAGSVGPRVESCPVCDERYVKCLGSTRGVVSWRVPCDDRCVYAEGPDCSCSCGGKNHGSRLLVPVLSGVVEFSGRGPLWMVDDIRAKWQAWRAELVAIEMGRPERVKLAFAAGRSGSDAERALVRSWSSWWSVLREGCDSWPARALKLRQFRAAFPDAGTAQIIGGAPVGAAAVGQLLLF